MKEKEIFGELLSKQFEIGDIVEWSKWNSEKEEWSYNYGIVTNTKSEIKSNRLVSICTVMPMQGDKSEIDHFSLSLRLISKRGPENVED